MKKGVFVIAGGSKGLGRTLADHAYVAGYPLALISRSEAELKKTKMELIERHGVKQAISIHALDLCNLAKVNKTFDLIKKEHGSISVLVNCAATWTGGKTVQELSVEDVQRSFDLNFYSAFNPIRATLEIRKKTKAKDLCIINIGATASLQGWDNVAAFCLAKGALRSLSQSLARELGSDGVHVAHLIIDGLIDNERTHKLNPKTPANKYISMKSLAETVMHVVGQEKSCWTFEWDVRPYNENW